MQKTIDEIRRILKRNEKELQERFKVRQMGIFGSYLRGDAKEGSDIDILVEFEEDARISLLDFVELENHLTGLLGIKVDLVEKPALKPRIGKHILREVVYL